MIHAPDVIDAWAKTYWQHYAGNGDVVRVSESNNAIYKVYRNGLPFALKIVTDHDLDLDVARLIEQRLSDRFDFAKTIDLDTSMRAFPARVVVQEWIDGVVLADAFGNDETSKNLLEAYVKSGIDLLERCYPMELAPSGYGYFKVGRPLHAGLADFFGTTLNRYGHKVERAIEGYLPEISTILLRAGARLNEIAHSDVAIGIIPVDVNLKNFILTVDTRLVTLSLPIVARSTFAHGLAALSFQARAAGASEDQVLSWVCHHDKHLQQNPPVRIDVALFEVICALGVLAFYCNPALGLSPIDVVGWGGQIKIIDLLKSAALAAEIL